MVAHVDLQHQDGRRDQQHAGDGVEGGVGVLDDIVHPTPEITGHDPQQDGRRQHHQGGEGADHQPGANALERLIEDILPHFIGSQQMVFRCQFRAPEQQHQHQSQGDQGHPPGYLAPPHEHPPRLVAKTHACPPGQQGDDNVGQHQGDDQALENAEQTEFEQIPGPVSLRVLQMSPTVFQPRVVSDRSAICQFDTLLGEEMGRQRG